MINHILYSILMAWGHPQLYDAREKGDFSLDQWKQPELNPKEETIHTVAWYSHTPSSRSSATTHALERVAHDTRHTHARTARTHRVTCRIFVVDTLNFAFWSDSEELFTVDYNGTLHNGYWSLCAAINRALDARRPPHSTLHPRTALHLELKRRIGVRVSCVCVVCVSCVVCGVGAGGNSDHRRELHGECHVGAAAARL